MTRDDLYAAAFRYKKTKLWKKLSETELFSVKLRNGEIGYICIMGEYGEFCALGLYIGEEGFRSYRIVAELGGLIDTEFMYHDVLMQQKCLQMILVSQYDLPPEEADEVRAYAKAHRIRLAGQNAFPQFVKCEPNYLPWKVKTEADMEALHDALEAAVLLADILKTKKPEELGIFVVRDYSGEVPLFELKDGKLVKAGVIALPKESEATYKYTEAVNEVAIASVKKRKKAGIWETELIRLPNPVQDNADEAPYYPAMLLVVNSEDGFLLPIMPVKGADFDDREMLQAFANALAMLEDCPKEIRCRDERTFALLMDFCKKTGIKCNVYDDEMPALDECEDSLLEHFEDGGGGGDDGFVWDDDGADESEDEIEAMFKMFLSMSPEELKLLPKPVLLQLKSLISSGLLPEEIASELREKLK